MKKRIKGLDLDSLNLDDDLDSTEITQENDSAGTGSVDAQEREDWLRVMSRGSNTNYEVWPLKSGEKAKFIRARLPFSMFNKLVVTADINGRDQQLLSRESLGNMPETIKKKQFFPAIVIERDDGSLNLLDGTRRNASAAIAEVGLDLLITKDDISIADAKQLSKDLQSARELNIRDFGLTLLSDHHNGLSREQIAEKHNESQGRVRRGLISALVDLKFLLVFPDSHLLSFANYELLSKIQEACKEHDIDLADFINEVTVHVVIDSDDALDIKNAWMACYQSQYDAMFGKAKKKADKPPAPKRVTVPLYKDGTNISIKKVTKGRDISFALRRIPADVSDRIEQFIKQEIEALQAQDQSAE